MQQAKQRLEQCLSRFRAGTLTEQDLEQALKCLDEPTCQRLLYLQANNTSVTSQIEGMSLVDDEGVHDGPDNPDDWPYQTVYEAMQDGWRIVDFPEMTLMLVGEEETHGLGCEFILEK